MDFDFLRSDIFMLTILIVNITLILLYISNMVKLKKLRISYMNFMKKLGNGDNLEEMLKKYVKDVEEIETKNTEIIEYCKKLDENITKCTQKIGIVRYNAFKDTGSDLSFSLAMLDNHNDGVVLNGIYARDMSNIYAKPIKSGESTYILTEEEKEAIQRAMKSANF